ncbi:OmpA family protein [Afipia massiliensis]|uniref:OmpA family protein n=1 Tax=Afipia massiliensis TaxID=211460 RepID=A0A4V6BEY1_9BRAD|nr:OmpA family protein [Afipia massiliensis]TKT71163.1 OmpA family protein [Afipia massiliensis]
MKNIRLLLLTTTAIAAVQLAQLPAHAETSSIVVAQAAAPADPNAPKAPPKAAPPAPPKAAPAPPPAPPRAAPPPPAPPKAAPPPPPPPRAAPPPPPAPPKAAPPPPPAAPKAAPPPAPPRAAPPPPPAPPKAAPPPPPAPPKAAPPPPPAAAPKAAPPPPAAAPKAAPAPTTAPPPPPAARPAPPTPAAPGAAPAPSGATPPAAPSTAPAPQRPPGAPPVAPGVRDVTPQRPDGARPPAPNGAAPTPAPTTPPAATTPATPPATPGATPPATPGATPPATPGATPPATPGATPGQPPAPGQPGSGDRRGQRQGPPPGLPAGTPVSPVTAPVATPLPPAPAAVQATPGALKPIAPTAAPGSGRRMDDFRSERRQTQEGGRTVFREPGRVIIQDPNGQSFVRHNEVDRFRYGARDVRVTRDGNDTRTVVVRPDGTQIITVNDRDGRLLRRIRRDDRGREVIIIDNRPRGGPGFGAGLAAGVVAGAIGGYFVSLPPPVLRIPQDRYIVEAEDAPPELLYETMMAPPVERIERRYSLDEIRYSPSVRQRMPSIDLDTINFETGSWEVPPDQAAKLQAIADGLNRVITANPRTVFLIEGHTDAVGNEVDNLSLSDRRAESAATLLTQQFNVPAENLTSQGYGEQYLKVPTDGAERRNRRVTIRNITPLLNGGQASLPPPPPGTAPPRR